MLVPSQAWLVQNLQATVTAFLASTCMVRLFQNNHGGIPADTVSAFTECNFAGYAAAPLVPSGATTWNVGLQAAVQAFSRVDFNASGSATPQTIYGAYVTNGVGSLLWSEYDPTAPFVIQPFGTYAYVPQYTRKAA